MNDTNQIETNTLNWQKTPLQYICKLNPAVNFDTFSEEDELTFLPMDRVKNGFYIQNITTFSKYSPSYNTFEEGDIVLAKVTPCFENGNIAIADNLINGKGFGSSELFVIRPNGAQARFLFYYFQSFDFKQEGVASMTGAGGLKRVSPDLLSKHSVVLPPPEIQTKIAKYLDRKTTEIDQLIAAKKNLLKLLDEKKRALIARAVTRGLNPDAPLKDSGIPWLGMIPEHWEVERSKWLLPEIDERSDTGEEELLTVSHLTGVTKRSDKDVNMFMAESLEGYKKCRKDDLVINTLWAWMGAMGVSPVDGVVSPAYNVYRPTERVLPEYLDMLVKMPNFISEITRYSKGVWSSRLRLYPEGLYEAHFPVPPIAEQRDIVVGIKGRLSQFKGLISVTEKTITLLQERRTALISAAVTGKHEEAYA